MTEAVTEKVAEELNKDIYTWYCALADIRNDIKKERSIDEMQWKIDLLYNDINRVSSYLFDLIGPVDP